MVEIDNYQDSSPDESDNVESSEGKSDSEESSRDEEDLLSLPICARDISGELYDLATWLEEVGSFPTKIFVRSRIPRESKLNKVLRKGENFHFKVTRNKNITGAKLMRLIKCNKLNKEQKLKCSLVLFVHSILLAHDRSKIVDSNHIKMVWIYEAFSYLKKYARKSLDTPLPIPRLLRWYTSKTNNIVEGDPFKYKGRSDHVDEVAVDAVDEVAVNVVDEVVVDDVAGDEVECAVDPVIVVDEVSIDVVAGAVDPVAVDVVDEVTVTVNDVAGVVDLVTVDIVDEVICNAIDEVAEQKEEEKTKEKSVDDEEEKEEDDCAKNDQWM
ncbi:hypothetical protein KY290_036900 [Solanum tuberosum]|uniref:Uncharacterized protein n=1 Tax=Solanum tuberosum TaxID=4113 RepID=A0ABQ7TUM5_SOLTU|nr:hypothetical protein KY290_036900 [Solanum tuberosum]